MTTAPPNDDDSIPLLPKITPSQPHRAPLHGRYVTLRPLLPSDSPALYQTIGGPTHQKIWTFLPDGPFTDPEPFTDYITQKSESEDPLFFVVLDHVTFPPTPVGHVTFMRITPVHRTIELGYIIFSDDVHRSPLTTETIYLMMKHVFEDLGYRRCEWKCDDRNGPSKRAAVRFGFTFEGVFKQHMIVKGINRDTAWFACLDGEWEWVKGGFERWLDEGNFDEGGRQRMGLVECRGEKLALGR